jgi:hypothetical protein
MKKRIFLIILIFLPLSSINNVKADKVYVIEEVVNVRAGPGLRFEVLTVARTNDVLERMKTEKGWAFVKLPNGKTGWISERLIKEKEIDHPIWKALNSITDQMVLYNNTRSETSFRGGTITQEGARLEIEVADSWYDLPMHQKKRLIHVYANRYAIIACENGLRKRCDETDYPTTFFVDSSGKEVAKKSTWEIEVFGQ